MKKFVFHIEIIKLKKVWRFSEYHRIMARLLDEPQRKLLDLLKSDGSISDSLTLREIWERIGMGYAQGVINKFRQLENKGYIRKDERGVYQVLKDPVENLFHFPLVGFAQCWNLAQMTLDDVSEQEVIPFPTKTLPINSKEELGRFFFTRAKWDSMEPDIRDWDLVLIRCQTDTAESNKTLLVHNGTPKIKYIKSGMNGQYGLVSLNKNIDTLEIIPKDEIAIIGTVKLVISSH